jgi:hypothetical protein
MGRGLPGTGRLIGAVLSVLLLAPAGPFPVSALQPGTGVTTASGGDRIEADVFRVSSDGGARPSDLAAYCLEAHSAIANARALADANPENPDPAAADPDLEPPHPGVPPDEDADTRPCRGRSARLVADPPGEPCPYGSAKAVAGYYYYDLDARSFRFLSSADYDRYRREGGDAGMWPTEHLCLDLFAGAVDRASFVEVVEKPRFLRSPDPIGLTGVDTWLWYDFGTPESHTITRSFTVDADGLALGVEATIWVDSVRWDMDGDGGWDVTLDVPDGPLAAASAEEYRTAGGSEDEEANAGAYLYETKATYPVTVEVRWRGIYEYVGYPGNRGFYEPVTAASTTEYQVCEVVAVRTTPGAKLDHPGCAPGGTP